MKEVPKAGVMTFLHNDNYGSILQAYALERVIESLHVEAEHIDYLPSQSEKLKNLIACGNSPSLILEGIRKRSAQGAHERAQAMDAFRSKRLHLSERCQNHADLEKTAERYDVLIAGSDQIWSPSWMNPAYFLDFAENTPKISYACSLGVKTMPGKKKAARMAALLSDFQSISVREDEGAELIHKITGKEVRVLPDPVLLLTPDEWLEIAEQKEKGSGRLLCYMIGTNPAYWERVKALRKETGLRVLVLPVTAESYQSGYELLDGAGPEEFLAAVRNAARFCTDSFHGFVFGTLYGTETEVMRRDREDDPESKNSRVDQFKRLIAEKTAADLRNEGRSWLAGHL